MNRFFLVTFQWPVRNGFGTRTITGGTDRASDSDAFDAIVRLAHDNGVPTEANIITFHLEPAK